MITLSAKVERFALREPFTIARGAKTEAVVVTVEARDGELVGRGEGLPYKRYGEDPDAVAAAVNGYGGEPTREAVRAAMAPGAARNGIDLALWDLEAKRTGQPVWQLAGLEAPRALEVGYTIPIRTPAETREIAARERGRPWLKLKLGGHDDLARVEAARDGAPDERFVVDANEGWDRGRLETLTPTLYALGVELIEQPVPADDDDTLAGWSGELPLCADESFRGEDLDAVAAAYGAVNVKLDKAGGLTAALELVEAARARNLKVMVGTMVATSLAVAPAILLAQKADWADLDAPLYLAEDRDPALRYEGPRVHPADPTLWG